MMEKYGFIYLWYDRKHKRYYIGCHWGTIDDGYVCSSTWMKNSYKRRPSDFKRRILETQISKNELLTKEHKWLQLISEKDLGSRYYNLHRHHFGHWSIDDRTNELVRKKLSESYKPRPLNSGNWVKGQEPWNKGKKIGPQPLEVIQKRAASNSKRRKPYKGASEYSSIKAEMYKDYKPSRIGKGGKFKQVKMGDMTYNSCTEASNKLGIHITTLSKWIKEGKAVLI